MLRPLALLVLALPGLGMAGFVGFAVSAASPVPIQDDDAVRIHMKVVRDPRATAVDRSAAMEALLELGTEGPRQLASELQKSAKDLGRRAAKDGVRLREAFAKRAGRILDARLDRAALREVEELRKKILKLTRSPGLTKETVVAESDPALERLEKLLVVTVEEVYEADLDLVAAREAHGAQLAEEAVLHDYWTRARDRLLSLPEGERISRRLAEPDLPAGAEESLDADLRRAASLATSMEDTDRRIFADNHAVRDKVLPPEAEGTEILNLLRVHLGLNALRLDPLLCLAGRDHCKDMIALDFFAHESPVEGKESPGKRAALAGTSASSENIAMGQPDAPRVIRAWWHSPGHHKNLLGNHARAGLGRQDDHWTQMFGN